MKQGEDEKHTHSLSLSEIHRYLMQKSALWVPWLYLVADDKLHFVRIHAVQVGNDILPIHVQLATRQTPCGQGSGDFTVIRRLNILEEYTHYENRRVGERCRCLAPSGHTHHIVDEDFESIGGSSLSQ